MIDPIDIPYEVPVRGYPRKAARDAGGGFIITVPAPSGSYKYSDIAISGPHAATVRTIATETRLITVRWPANPDERQPITARVYYHYVDVPGSGDIEDGGEYVLLPPP